MTEFRKPLSNVGVYVLVLVISSVLYAPQLFAPIMGDDLVNPFFNELETDGSFEGILGILKLIPESGHINFLGVAIGSIHSILWLRFDFLFGTPHWFFYFLSKLTIFHITILSVSLFLNRILHLSKVVTSRIFTHSIIAIVFISTSQIHQLWSNDPVSNYLLTGYPSALIGITSIFCFCMYLQYHALKYFILSVFLILIGILYYEINFAIILAISILTLANLKNQKESFTRISPRKLMLFIVVFILVTLLIFARISNSTVYSGTSPKIGFDAWKSFLIGILSGIPSAGWPQSFYQMAKFGFTFGLIELLFIALLGGLILFFLKESQIFVQNKKYLPNIVNLNFRNNNRTIKYFIFGITLYGIFSVLVQSGAEKYQKEITTIGETYMFYSQLHLISVFLISYFITKQFPNNKKTKQILLTVFIFGAIQITLNNNLVRSAYMYSDRSQVVLSQFNSASSGQERCLSLRNWELHPWPEDYRLNFLRGIEFSYVKFFHKSFCESQLFEVVR